MLRTQIDHLVITSPTLAIGVEYIHDTLGVALQVGGEHMSMGTHNCLLRLGDTVYLEVISINRDGKKPDRPRWFQLDNITPNSTPNLAGWVARTNNIRTASELLSNLLGNIEEMYRDKWHWQITIPGDGSLPFEGIAPMLIQWMTKNHPASSLQDKGCSLVNLEGFHPQATRIAEILNLINFQDVFFLTPIKQGKLPYLVAQIITPSGTRQLGKP